MLTIALGVALGIIVALLVLRFWPLALALAVVGIVLGVLGWFLVMPAIATYMKVTSENPEAVTVYVGIVSFYAAIAIAYYLWDRYRRKPKRTRPGQGRLILRPNE